jgi:hypothetical protein
VASAPCCDGGFVRWLVTHAEASGHAHANNARKRQDDGGQRDTTKRALVFGLLCAIGVALAPQQSDAATSVGERERTAQEKHAGGNSKEGADNGDVWSTVLLSDERCFLHLSLPASMLSTRVLPLAAVLLCLACALLLPASSVSAQDGPLTCAPFQLFETPTQLNDTNKCQAFKQNACCGAGIAARAYNVSATAQHSRKTKRTARTRTNESACSRRVTGF